MYRYRCLALKYVASDDDGEMRGNEVIVDCGDDGEILFCSCSCGDLQKIGRLPTIFVQLLEDCTKTIER